MAHVGHLNAMAVPGFGDVTRGMSQAVSFQNVAHERPAARERRLRAAECGPTGLWRSLSRSAGFLERLEPAPAAAASREVLPAPAEPCTAPGHGPEPTGQAQPEGGTRRTLLCANTVPFSGGMVPHGNRERAAPTLQGSSSLWGPCPEGVEKGWGP